ncbi:hypothetical protein M758_1G093700 [Ceratodon purpureus]|uniref:O-fucosyltransferase family protein n=1 Tax=Ceratodon purpureus TaxID=3225 RepID=A0A8T0J3C9_CERPU|nr:hypothetical protein KC19_1G098100 [Ceratodon purpureus]KAG0629314.1 hypothetical protein M758_1G093700 [Ceratodon purpureus]
MQGRQYRRMNSRSRSPGASGALHQMLWITAYLSVTLAALFCTYVFPDMFHKLRSRAYSGTTVSRIMLSKENLGGKTHESLSWQQELAPLHRLRSTKLALHTEDEELGEKLWAPPDDKGFGHCVKPNTTQYLGPGPSRGYLMVSTNGGLNQMRAGICDMVAIARLINATLVIPELDQGSFWQDSSNFSDVFDMNYFIKALSNDVPVVKTLPPSVKTAPKVMKQFKSWSNMKYYEEEIGRLWHNYKVIKAAKSDSRLANNHLSPDIQKLRCRVHYDALRFAPHIEALGKVLVDRMRAAGPYIALHLRYEKDMLAFSGCTHGLTREESKELTTIREKTPHWKIKKINATEQRSKGFCPLTPNEVGVFLKSLGYPETTRVYVAAGEIYGGRERMSGLLRRFPHVMSKETIATADELAPFLNHSSQMAALDYIVSVGSDVFIPSFSGNMARAVEGHRRFLGHRKTILPDRKELVALFDQLDKGLLHEDKELAEMITKMHENRQGAPRKRKGPLKGTKGRDRLRSEEAFYTNPTPDCLCQQPDSFAEDVNYEQNFPPRETYRGMGQLQSGAAIQKKLS